LSHKKRERLKETNQLEDRAKRQNTELLEDKARIDQSESQQQKVKCRLFKKENTRQEAY